MEKYLKFVPELVGQEYFWAKIATIRIAKNYLEKAWSQARVSAMSALYLRDVNEFPEEGK